MRLFIKNIVFVLLASLLAACHQKVENVVVEVPVLRASYIYRIDSVYAYMQKYRDTNREIADYYFNKGKELEGKDTAKAIYYLKRAITLDPGKKYYLELGSLYNKTRNYSAMNDVYNLFVCNFNNYIKVDYPFGKPDEQLVIEEMISCILTTNTVWGYGWVMKDDIDKLGFDLDDIKAKVLSDKRIKLDKNSEDYKNLELQFLNDDEIAEYMSKESTFQTFLLSIKDTASTFEIDRNKVQQFDYENFNGRNYNGMGDAAPPFSTFYYSYLKEKQDNPKSWYSYNYEHRVKLNDSINAIIYSIDTSAIACPREMRHIYHRLVTYGKNTRIIDSKIVALQSGTELATMQFNHDKFSITYYKRTWEKPYVKTDYDNNITKTEEQGKKDFQIMPDGSIKEITSPTPSAGSM